MWRLLIVLAIGCGTVSGQPDASTPPIDANPPTTSCVLDQSTVDGCTLS